MQWADCGSLDDFIADRLGRAGGKPSASNTAEQQTRSARIRAIRAAQAAAVRETAAKSRPERKTDGGWRTVHLVSADEARSLLRDMVEGLAFLVSCPRINTGTNRA
jgi:hypothetical protein